MIAASWLLMLAAVVQYDGRPVADRVLAGERGGFELPNGIDVAITVQTQTVLDGAVVLKTVFQADRGPATLTTYVPKPGETVAAPPAGTSAVSSAGAAPKVTYDRQGGIQITPGAVTPMVSIGSVRAAGAGGGSDGLVAVDAAKGIVSDAGVISRANRAGLDTVRLETPDLSITHFAGNAFGSAVANSGNDRAIDTTTAISIDLSNAGPDVLGSAMLRVQDVAGDALRGRL